MHHDLIEKELCAHHGYKLCWSAVVAGALVGIGLGFLLHLYSIALGLTAFTATSGTMTITIGGIIGLVIGSIVAMGMAGFTAGYLGHGRGHGVAILYGFTTWSLALLLTAVIALPMNHYIMGLTASLAPNATVDVDKKDQRQVVSVESQQNDIAKSTSAQMITIGGWIIFLLFAVGAIASCLGALAAVSCHRKHCHQDIKAHTQPVV